MSDSTASLSEQRPSEEAGADAFGSLSMSRPGAERTVLPPQGAPVESKPEPVATKEERLKLLIPPLHRESFSHSATWWQNNIEIFKHKTSGRYLYLSKEGDDGKTVHAYQYMANGHRFVEVELEAALAFATAGEKVGEKKRF